MMADRHCSRSHRCKAKIQSYSRISRGADARGPGDLTSDALGIIEYAQCET